MNPLRPHPIYRPARRRVSFLSVSSLPVHLVLGMLLSVLASPGALRGQEVAKACGPKWAKKAATLDAEQLNWMLARVAVKVTRDLDGDGELDTITLSNTPSFRSCDVRATWDQRETQLDIEYTTGKKQRFHWIRNQRIERLKLYREIGRILIVGVDANGAPNNKWVDYGQTVPALLAPMPEQPGLLVAGTAP